MHFFGRLYKCPTHRGIFVFPAQCNQDRRFQDVLPSANQILPKVVASSSKSEAGQMFGAKDCPIVVGSVAPLSKNLGRGFEWVASYDVYDVSQRF